MAKKINLSGVKEFMFHHGEKVALGTCVFLALSLGIMGLMRAMGANRTESGRSFADELDAKAKEITSKIAGVQPAKLPADTESLLLPSAYVWDPITSSFVQQHYLNTTEVNDNKRNKPTVLTIRTDPVKNDGKPKLPPIQLDYVRSLIFAHDVIENNTLVNGLLPAGVVAPPPPMKVQKGQVAPPVALWPFLRKAEPLRFVVGTAIFPMKEQVEEFRRALKLASQKALFDPPQADLPQPLGFNLMKVEWRDGKPASKPEKLVSYEGGQLIVAPRLKEVLSKAFYDETTPELMKEYIFAGLNMPMPKLAYGQYPKLLLQGIDIEYPTPEEMKKEGGIMPPKKERPMLPGERPNKKPPMAPPPPMEGDPKMAGGDRTVRAMTRKQLKDAGETELEQRLFAKEFNIFHVFGWKPPEVDPAVASPAPAQGGRKPMGANAAGSAKGDFFFTAWGDWPAAPLADLKQAAPVQPGKIGAAPVEPPFPNWERDALVRFIDVDVVPGKSYRYYIQIRLANPNYKLSTDLIAFGTLADPVELVSEWEQTPTITIPEEYFLYAVDQKLQDDMIAGANHDPKQKAAKDTTTFQIHQWIDKKRGEHDDNVIGDWAIAERVVVHKGDYIGLNATVQVPVWRANKDSFEVPLDRNPKEKGFVKPGLRLNLVPPTSVPDPLPAVLIDFTGGKRKIGTGTLEEETAVDALILTPDGKLRVLNSRNAADPEFATAEERSKRVERSRNRVKDELQGPGTGGPNLKGGGPKLPGVPGGT